MMIIIYKEFNDDNEYLSGDVNFDKMLHKMTVIVTEDSFYYTKDCQGWIWEEFKPFLTPVNYREECF